jgi:GH15 family glucan-1,4-alpha-glucosidase
MRPFIAFLIILNLGIAAYGLWLRPMSEAEDPSQIAEVNPERIRLLPQVDDSEIVSADPFCVELLETNEETREELNKMFYEMNIDIEMTALTDEVEKSSVLKISPNPDYSQEQILGMLDQNLSKTNFSAVECSPETAD